MASFHKNNGSSQCIPGFVDNTKLAKNTHHHGRFLPVLGVVEGVIGPTLLDLKDFIGVSLGSISFIIMVSSIGSMVGCFLAGYIMDKLVKLQYLMLAGDNFTSYTILL